MLREFFISVNKGARPRDAVAKAEAALGKGKIWKHGEAEGQVTPVAVIKRAVLNCLGLEDTPNVVNVVPMNADTRAALFARVGVTDGEIGWL